MRTTIRNIFRNPLARRPTASIFLVLLLATVAYALPPHASPQTRISRSLDSNWHFFKGDLPQAQNPEFDDSAWRTVRVPHDWSIEGTFSETNPAGQGGAFLPGGVGWYRRRLPLPQEYAGRRIFVDFDGVMANSEVWINGFSLGKRPSGYVSFRYELTGHLNFGPEKPNILAVRADNSSQPASRWYSGAGIYRHVHLIATNPVHIDHWATFITTPKVKESQATAHLHTTVLNQGDVPKKITLQFTLFDPDGRPVQTVEAKSELAQPGKALDFDQDVLIKSPRMWDLDHPSLYRIATRVRTGNTVLDEEITVFGIREFRFEPETGFWLNGRNLKIKGVGLHHDASAFGAAVPLRAWERRLEALRRLGVNAIRTAHDPPSPEFLDLADRMGFLVMEEVFDCWTVAKNPYDYHLYFKEWSTLDLRDSVRRDRNHASIFIYSAGNEIRDTPNAALAKEILSSLIAAFHESDPTRPVTQALFRPNVSHDYDDGLADLLDVVGQNYRENEILAAHTQKPSRKILGTENGHDLTTWLALRDHPPFSGQFLWSGIDYLGEAGRWPATTSNSGLLDRTGSPRPFAFQRQSWWSNQPMVFLARRVAPTSASSTEKGSEPPLQAPQRRPQILFADWTPRTSNAHDENVEVFSNCEQVELFLNDKPLGTKSRPADDSSRNWQVPYEPGSIRAVCSNGGKVAATHELRTAGRPARIMLAADRARLSPDWDDVSYVTATVVDENGVVVPTTNTLITFKISGPGVVAAVDSGDNSSHEAFQASERRVYQGSCFAMLRATSSPGRISLTASAPDVAGSSIEIGTTEPPASEDVELENRTTR